MRRRGVLPMWVLSWSSLLGAFAVLEVVGRSGLVAGASLPPSSEILAALASEVVDGGFWAAVGNTLQGYAIGLAIAVGIAVPLGIVIGTSEVAYRATHVLIEFLRPIPSVALIPLAILIYGTGLQSKVFLVVFACTWPLLIQTLYGVRDVDPVAKDTARSFGYSKLSTLVRVVIPAALPFIATGLRIASSVAVILAVTAEIVIGSPGLGQDIELARSGGATDTMYALVLMTGVLGLVLNSLLARVEARALHWHPSQRRAEVWR